MKKQKKLIIISLIILLQSSVYVLGADTYTKDGDYIKATCTCTCRGAQLTSSAMYKPGILDILDGGRSKVSTLCQQQCARNCGGFTDCPTQNNAECTACCQTYCSDSSNGYGGSSIEFCNPSCKSTCSYMEIVKGITDLVYMVAGVIAALMIIIHGLRIVTSDDPNERNAAKNSIIYVVIALVIIVLAGILVRVFLRPGTIPGL